MVREIRCACYTSLGNLSVIATARKNSTSRYCPSIHPDAIRGAHLGFGLNEEVFYEAPRDLGKPVEDTEDFELPGEDDDNEGARTPIRILTDFTIFDSKHRNILVPLDYREKEKVPGSQMVAVGMVKVYVADREDEDEGQEDEEEDDDRGVQMKLGDFTHQFNYEKPYE